MSEFVSLIIPTHNRRKDLEKCLLHIFYFYKSPKQMEKWEKRREEALKVILGIIMVKIYLMSIRRF